MTRWIVFEPPVNQPVGPASAATEPSEQAVFVRDAFVKWAVIFPFLWLFRHGLILAGILVVAIEIGVGILLADRPGLSIAAAGLPLLLGVLVALEGPSLRATRYRKRGYVEAAVVEADDEEEAAILYFTSTAGQTLVPEGMAAETSRAGPPKARSAYFQTRMLRAEGRSLLDPVRRT